MARRPAVDDTPPPRRLVLVVDVVDTRADDQVDVIAELIVDRASRARLPRVQLVRAAWAGDTVALALDAGDEEA